MALTERQIQNRWNKNVKAVQDAKADLDGAMRDYGRIGTEAGTLIAPLRRKAWMGQLSPTEADVVEEQEARIAAARDVIEAARLAVEDAQATFKAGVVED